MHAEDGMMPATQLIFHCLQILSGYQSRSVVQLGGRRQGADTPQTGSRRRPCFASSRIGCLLAFYCYRSCHIATRNSCGNGLQYFGVSNESNHGIKVLDVTSVWPTSVDSFPAGTDAVCPSCGNNTHASTRYRTRKVRLYNEACCPLFLCCSGRRSQSVQIDRR
jgi:hypothetical protein